MINVLDIKNKNVLVLDDAVDTKRFQKSKAKVIKNTCFYSGSFVEGKGIEIIQQLALQLPNFYFHLYGNIKTYNKLQNLSNFPTI